MGQSLLIRNRELVSSGVSSGWVVVFFGGLVAAIVEWFILETEPAIHKLVMSQSTLIVCDKRLILFCCVLDMHAIRFMVVVSFSCIRKLKLLLLVQVFDVGMI
jgi:hypothetical protein